METPAVIKHSYRIYDIDVFWDEEYKYLDYIHEPFNDLVSVTRWMEQGYQAKICGDLADMRGRQPRWNSVFIDHFVADGWQDIGTAYYRMTSGTVMPVHQDLYIKYIELFNLQGQEHRIRRAVVLLEPWASGHYLEIMEEPVTKWPAGRVVEWCYDTPHMAANLGLTPRYTLQITGHV